MDESPELERLRNELNAITREILNESPAKRYGWKHSKLDQGQVEYILDRQAVIEAVKLIQRVSWQSINCEDKSLADTIREFALHSLATMAQSMSKNEDKIL